MKLKIKKMRETAILPSYKTEGAAGMDFHASLDGIEEGLNEYVVMPGEIVKIPLGVAVQLETGYEIQVLNRSGITMSGVIVHVGTGDSDYRGELNAMVHNLSTRAFVIENGDRICQAVIREVITPQNGLEVEYVDELDPTERGEKGFGSTGK